MWYKFKFKFKFFIGITKHDKGFTNHKTKKKKIRKKEKKKKNTHNKAHKYHKTYNTMQVRIYRGQITAKKKIWYLLILAARIQYVSRIDSIKRYSIKTELLLSGTFWRQICSKWKQSLRGIVGLKYIAICLFRLSFRIGLQMHQDRYKSHFDWLQNVHTLIRSVRQFRRLVYKGDMTYLMITLLLFYM